MRCFQKVGQSEFFERVFHNFQCGFLGDETAIPEVDHGLQAYWGLVSMSRPMDEEHRNKVERMLNESYMDLYNSNNKSWNKVVYETRPWVTEA